MQNPSLRPTQRFGTELLVTSGLQALAMIKKIFKARWQDEQLIDSGLSYDELPIIAEVFVQVWQQFNHKRIVYPKGALDYRGNK